MKLFMLESKMKLHKDRYLDLAKALGITPQTLSEKKNGKNGRDFSISEVKKIQERYDLLPDEVYEIFFTNEVS